MQAIFELAVIAIAYALFSVAVQRHPKIGKRQRMYEIQAQMKQASDEMNAMAKNGASKEDMMAKQKEMMPLLSESMKLQLKPMLVVFPVLIILYYFLLPMSFPKGLTIDLLSFKLSYQYFFIIVSFVVAFPLSMIFMAMDKKRYGKKPAQQPVQAQ